jgi:hypothetical protein
MSDWLDYLLYGYLMLVGFIIGALVVGEAWALITGR